MIGWVGVDKRKRGSGIGRMLFERVEQDLARFGYKELRVETVGECSPSYGPYRETLRFYQSMGFVLEKKGRLRHDMGFRWRHSTFVKRIGTG